MDVTCSSTSWYAGQAKSSGAVSEASCCRPEAVQADLCTELHACEPVCSFLLAALHSRLCQTHPASQAGCSADLPRRCQQHAQLQLLQQLLHLPWQNARSSHVHCQQNEAITQLMKTAQAKEWRADKLKGDAICTRCFCFGRRAMCAGCRCHQGKA